MEDYLKKAVYYCRRWIMLGEKIGEKIIKEMLAEFEEIDNINIRPILYDEAEPYLNIPMHPHDYSWEYHYLVFARIRDFSKKMIYTIEATYFKMNEDGLVRKTIETIRISEIPLISRKTTPITAKWINKIAWRYINEEWRGAVVELIYEMARAEIEGKINDAIKKLIKMLREKKGILAYQYLHDALIEAINN